MFAELSAEQIEKVSREISCFLEHSAPRVQYRRFLKVESSRDALAASLFASRPGVRLICVGSPTSSLAVTGAEDMRGIDVGDVRAPLLQASPPLVEERWQQLQAMEIGL